MRKLLFLTLLLIALTIGANEFYMNDSVVQGEVLTLVISPVEESLDYIFELFDFKGSKIVTISGFNYYYYENMTSMVLGLMGIPSNLPPGEYKVKATGRGLLNTYFFERPLYIESGEYPTSELIANEKMDSIINTPLDDERIEQSKRLWDAISTFSPYILHEDGPLIKPVKGRHSSPFGYTRFTKFPSGRDSSSVHKGEDLAADIGTPVLSDGRGRVLLSESRVVTGNTVVVEHLPGVVSIYYHMDSLVVERGDYLEKGDKIGEVGSTGYSTGPHLHWELRFGTVPVNPMVYLSKPLLDKSLIMTMISEANNKKGG
ncbi:M23 family metallopeptidase [Thiospirochaeta perfilievii]|uniref:M23 family metallopeptidase n=1 Tax=Thiospirochaeta perfilievii TaxID=252967 RepID=A0A5C1QH39_9SPIO|nr:M23 family metallopeptidase [Thiospirochaeta perfilievii]QEN05562.1 M23 family metallopeptidase [Thiospirochaeta perfilievii]